MTTQTTNPKTEMAGNEHIKGPTIKDLHKTSWKGLFIILRGRGTLSKWPFYVSVIISLSIAVFLLLASPTKTYDVLSKTSDLLVTVFPGLLGFSLGGYAIVVGFSNTQLIQESAKTDKASIYQLLNSIFTLSLLIQVYTTIFSLLVNWVIKSELFKSGGIDVPIVGYAFNAVIIFLMLWGAIYSLLLTPYIIINLFTLSQMNNLFFTIKKIKGDE